MIHFDELDPKTVHDAYLKSKKHQFNGVFIGFHKAKSFTDNNLPKERSVALSGLPFKYYTNSTFPLMILMACNTNPKSIVMYNFQDRMITDKELTAIFRASKTCRMGIRVPVIFGKTDPLDVEVYLFDLIGRVERVELDFIGLTVDQLQNLPRSDRQFYYQYNGLWYMNTKARLWYYASLHEVLARYMMQLYMIAETKSQAKVLKQKGLEIANEK